MLNEAVFNRCSKTFWPSTGYHSNEAAVYMNCVRKTCQGSPRYFTQTGSCVNDKCLQRKKQTLRLVAMTIMKVLLPEISHSIVNSIS